MTSIKDVANLAGVSVGTVSRVINNSGGVKPRTRKKVEEAIQILNYIPNEVARNFKMQKSKMVALLIPSICNPFYSKLEYFMEGELDRQGFKLMLCNSGGKPEKELYYLDMLRQNKVAGIVAITCNDIEDKMSIDIPIVSIDRHFDEKTTCVTSDNYEGGRLAVKELVKVGVRNPAFIGSDTSIFCETMNRREGFIHEAQALGLDYVIYEKPDSIVDDGVYFNEFFNEHTDVDGIFAITDILAASFIERARRQGKRVPEDVKVIGYGGIQENCYFHPVLSTIMQPVEEMAQMVIKLLFNVIENIAVDQQVYRLPVVFRKGETT